MATTATPTLRRPLLRPQVLIGTAALLAPLSYLAGRLTLNSWLITGALGAMAGIPVGLFFGSLIQKSSKSVPSDVRGNTVQTERSILSQLRAELAENWALFEARQGSTTMYARIDYITAFWSSIKASGRLFVMQDVALLNTIALAYYWLEQATHLETLAYEAKYAHPEQGDHGTAARLLNEARILDGQLSTSLGAAMSAIDKATAAH